MSWPLLALVSGPSASGKSALALGLAERVSLEIVSCDSLQDYRGLDIGVLLQSDRFLAPAQLRNFQEEWSDRLPDVQAIVLPPQVKVAGVVRKPDA